MKIGNLTSDYRDGIEILEIIKKKKIFKYIEENDFFIGLESRVYIYSSIEDKEEHQNQMVKEGWETEDEVYELLRDYQNKFNNLSKSVSDWVRSKYDKELN